MPKYKIEVVETPNSLFGDRTYPRFEVKISPATLLIPTTKLDEIIEEKFPGVQKSKIKLGCTGEVGTLILVQTQK